MEILSGHWLIENTIDFEYKKYLILAFLQKVEAGFQQIKLYPYLQNLRRNILYLEEIEKQKRRVKNFLPKKIKKIDLQKKEIIWEPSYKANIEIPEIDKIIEFALPRFISYHKTGQEIENHIIEKIKIYPVGVLPHYIEEGYLFISPGKERTFIFRYNASIYSDYFSEHRTLHTRYLFSSSSGIKENYNELKYTLVKQNKDLPVPAAFGIECEKAWPLKQTILPIAEKLTAEIIEQLKREIAPFSHKNIS